MLRMMQKGKMKRAMMTNRAKKMGISNIQRTWKLRTRKQTGLARRTDEGLDYQSGDRSCKEDHCDGRL